MEENIHSGEQVVAADFIIISDETDKIHKLLDHEETHGGEGRDMVAGDGIETVAGINPCCAKDHLRRSNHEDELRTPFERTIFEIST